LPPAEKAPGAFPNMSLDEHAGATEEPLDILDVGPASGSAVGVKKPADLEIFDLIEGDVAEREGSSINLERPPSDKPSGVDIIAEELESQVGLARKTGEKTAPECAG